MLHYFPIFCENETVQLYGFLIFSAAINFFGLNTNNRSYIQVRAVILRIVPLHSFGYLKRYKQILFVQELLADTVVCYAGMRAFLQVSDRIMTGRDFGCLYDWLDDNIRDLAYGTRAPYVNPKIIHVYNINSYLKAITYV